MTYKYIYIYIEKIEWAVFISPCSGLLCSCWLAFNWLCLWGALVRLEHFILPGDVKLNNTFQWLHSLLGGSDWILFFLTWTLVQKYFMWCILKDYVALSIFRILGSCRFIFNQLQTDWKYARTEELVECDVLFLIVNVSYNKFDKFLFNFFPLVLISSVNFPLLQLCPGTNSDLSKDEVHIPEDTSVSQLHKPNRKLCNIWTCLSAYSCYLLFSAVERCHGSCLTPTSPSPIPFNFTCKNEASAALCIKHF